MPPLVAASAGWQRWWPPNFAAVAAEAIRRRQSMEAKWRQRTRDWGVPTPPSPLWSSSQWRCRFGMPHDAAAAAVVGHQRRAAAPSDTKGLCGGAAVSLRTAVVVARR